MRVMLVEPSKVGLKLMAKMIEDMGHVVIGISDGNEALRHLHQDANLDVLMTSFEVPGVSGIQLCWEGRIIANRGRPIYVIAMSSSNDSTHLVEALDSGADDFINKPPKRIELEARLRAAERLNQARRELVHWATRDALTSLLNRRAYFNLAEDMMRSGGPLSVMLFDIDHFKSVNDTYGHDGGDLVLVAVARMLWAHAGRAARIGGEEFAILMPGVTETAAFEEAEGLRLAIEGMAVSLPEGVRSSVTISLGVAQRWPDEDVDHWMKRADMALYAAKNEGRNRAVMARHLPEQGAAQEPERRRGAHR